MAEKFRAGDSVELRQIYAGSYFFCAGLHYKTNVTRNNGTVCLCHPVTGGQYVNIIQDKINVWILGTELVQLALVMDADA